MQISDKLKEALKSGNIYAPDTKVTISSTGGEETVFTSDDILSNIEVSQTALSDAGSPIGGLAVAELTVNLVSYDSYIDKIIDLDKDYLIKFQMDFDGEIFTSNGYDVESIEVAESRTEITIKAKDKVMRLEEDYIEPYDSSEYPMTASKWLEGFSRSYALDIDCSQLPFMEEEINQPNVDNMSAKQVFSKFLEWNFAAGALVDDVLVCRVLSNPKDLEPTEDIDRDSVTEFISYNSDLGEGVNTLTLALSEDVESENFSVASPGIEDAKDTVEIRLSGNPFFSTQDEREKFAPMIFKFAEGFNYQPYELDTRLLYLRPLSILKQTELDPFRDEVYNLPVYDYQLTYDGAFNVTLAAPVMDSAETAYKWKKLSPSKRTEIKVDKIEGQITSVVNETEIIDGRLSEQESLQTQTKDKLETEIVNRQEEDEVIREEISNVKQTVEGIEINVQHNNGVNLLKNSVLFNDLEYWESSNGESVAGEMNSWALTTDSRHAIVFRGTGWLTQTVNIVPGQSYSLSFKVNKPTDAGNIVVGYKQEEDSPVIPLYQSNIDDRNINFTGTIEEEISEITIYLGVGGANPENPVSISDLIVTKGNITEWSPHPNEIYSLTTLIDEEGIKVKNSDGNGYTVMNPHEFASYFNNEKVFTINQDISEVMGLKVKSKGMYVPPIKYVQGQNKLFVVWTGVD